jgi:hypothetical protein
VCGNHTLRVKSHSLGVNCTLRVEITLVRVEITLVRVDFTLCVEITLYVYKSHSCVSLSHSECHIHTYTCQNYSRVTGNHTLRVKSHSACVNRTLRVEINLVCVGITFVPVEITLRVEITLCVQESRSSV